MIHLILLISRSFLLPFQVTDLDWIKLCICHFLDWENGIYVQWDRDLITGNGMSDFKNGNEFSLL